MSATNILVAIIDQRSTASNGKMTKAEHSSALLFSSDFPFDLVFGFEVHPLACVKFQLQ